MYNFRLTTEIRVTFDFFYQFSKWICIMKIHRHIFFFVHYGVSLKPIFTRRGSNSHGDGGKWWPQRLSPMTVGTLISNWSFVTRVCVLPTKFVPFGQQRTAVSNLPEFTLKSVNLILHTRVGVFCFDRKNARRLRTRGGSRRPSVCFRNS